MEHHWRYVHLRKRRRSRLGEKSVRSILARLVFGLSHHGSTPPEEAAGDKEPRMEFDGKEARNAEDFVHATRWRF